MLHYAHAKKPTIDEESHFEKYILSWLHSVGFDLPLVGKYLIQYGSAAAKFPHRIIFRSELLPLFGYIEKDNEQKSGNGAYKDIHLLQNLHALGLTLFDLKNFFDVDFDICEVNNNETERANVGDAPEIDPTYIAKQLWNDLEEEAKTAIETKSDLWDEKKGRKCQTLLTQLKFNVVQIW